MKVMMHMMWMAGAAMVVAMAGCANIVQRGGPLGGETYTVNPPQAVLDTPEIAAYRVQRQQWADDGLVASEPWWQTRNDARLNLRPGANTASVTDYLIYVHDQQYSSGGRVYNSYRRDAYSGTYGRISR